MLDESTIRLDVLEHVSLEWARIFNALVVFEDDRAIVIAAARPEDAIVPARELGAARGKNVELRIALDITLARTIRVALSRSGSRARRTSPAPRADRKRRPYLAIVQPDGAASDEHRRAQRALAEDAARNIERRRRAADRGRPARSTLTGDWQVSTITDVDRAREPTVEERTMVIAADLDRVATTPTRTSRRPIRALVVDPDPPGRMQLVAELEKLGWRMPRRARGRAGGRAAVAA